MNSYHLIKKKKNYSNSFFAVILTAIMIGNLLIMNKINKVIKDNFYKIVEITLKCARTI